MQTSCVARLPGSYSLAARLEHSIGRGSLQRVHQPRQLPRDIGAASGREAQFTLHRPAQRAWNRSDPLAFNDRLTVFTARPTAFVRLCHLSRG
jgi:hypothetical protein